jgi:hypothetical protein
MTEKRIEPSISAVAFSCPHCGALADQTWFDLYADAVADHGTPFRPDQQMIEVFKQESEVPADLRKNHIRYVERAMSGEVFFEAMNKTLYNRPEVVNLTISRCYSCEALTVWLHDSVLHPPSRAGVEPNADLPTDTLRDYNEARSIIDLSPRGAAALLRLAIQKLCIHLGESGRDINGDIASLVKKGLDKRVQKALDIVRVIGNESVHPGTIDMRDNRDTANSLFGLVNLIAEKMITEPNHVEALYGTLPKEKRDAIDQRDGSSKPKS